MTDTKSKSIPRWQRQEIISSQPEGHGDQNSKSEALIETSLPQSTLMKHAAKFLEDESIRDAPIADKVAFLKSKGLMPEDIQEVLGMLSNDIAGSKDGSMTGNDKLKSTALTPPHDVSPAQATTPSSGHSPIPPIITYPEFLIHTQKKPPLITTPRVLAALYVSSATTAVIYGTSQYLVKPMLESLTTARQSLFETAASNLESLNQKLETIVSRVPSRAAPSDQTSHGVEIDNEDTGSDVSDPTELFHRDTGTQTSAPPSPSTSTVSTSESDPSSSNPSSMQGTRLKSLHSTLSSILSVETSGADEDDTTIQSLGDLRIRLNDITYGRIRGSLQGDSPRSQVDDEIQKVKAEIRGVKGVLLSARSFPSVGSGRARAAGT